LFSYSRSHRRIAEWCHVETVRPRTLGYTCSRNSCKMYGVRNRVKKGWQASTVERRKTRTGVFAVIKMGYQCHIVLPFQILQHNGYLIKQIGKWTHSAATGPFYLNYFENRENEDKNLLGVTKFSIHLDEYYLEHFMSPETSFEILVWKVTWQWWDVLERPIIATWPRWPKGTDHCSSEEYRCTHVEACVARTWTWISYRCVPCHPWCTHWTSLVVKQTCSVFLWLWTIPLR
jgi:hypothetical protein